MQIALVLEVIHLSPGLERAIICFELPTDSKYFILTKKLRTPCEINPDIQFSLGLVKIHLLNELGLFIHKQLAEELFSSKHLTCVL